MAPPDDANERLAQLRADVEVVPGPDADDGSPTWLLHDPLRGSFDKLTWTQAEIVRRLDRPRTLAELQARLRRETTLRVSDVAVRALVAELVRKGLVTERARPQHTSPPEARRSYGVATTFRRIAFLRIPLLRPDRFLEHTLPVARLVVHPAAVALHILAATAGVVFLVQRFESYIATFPHFFSVGGIAAFALALVAVKSVHEFSHAYVARGLGSRVARMGIALIFLFPVAFADVTDSWRLRDRRQRLRISLAGILAELTIAGWALLLWALVPDGTLKSICFVLSSVTLLSTLLVNLNPAMRFDGYYILSDLLGIDNLQTRSFAATRWWLRRRLLGFEQPPPEPRFTSRRLTTFVLYALGAWAYRLLLYTGIAVGLYVRVTKVVGIALFIAAIYTFLVRPLGSEFMHIFRNRLALRRPRRLAVTSVALLAVITWAAWPLPRRTSLPAIVVAPAAQVLYAPCDGVLRDLNLDQDNKVCSGQALFRVESYEKERGAELAELELRRLDLEIALARMHDDLRPHLRQKQEERARLAARYDAIQVTLERSICTANMDGHVVELDPGLRDGVPVAANQRLGRIVADGTPKLIAYIPIARATDIHPGRSATFVSDAIPRPRPVTIQFIEPTRGDTLEHRALASVAGGPIAVRASATRPLETVTNYCQVELTFDDAATSRCGQTGRVWFMSPPRSRLRDALHTLYGVLLRESSF